MKKQGLMVLAASLLVPFGVLASSASALVLLNCVVKGPTKHCCDGHFILNRSCGFLGHDCGDTLISNPIVRQTKGSSSGKSDVEYTTTADECEYTPRGCKTVGCETFPKATVECDDQEQPSGGSCGGSSSSSGAGGGRAI